jgi:hypothetical protein
MSRRAQVLTQEDERDPAVTALQAAQARDIATDGPDLDDPFRFTWWTTPEGTRVWIEHRGKWLPGVVASRGRKRAGVMIEVSSS